ncbi:MAG: UDP-N-acetylmuramoyl-tripeptide--D-alanyl-D-alanine ligase [Ruminococcaceae bacterium]|nr:UDP-N-acetylmuramoyl-tripeptide--D-alanyl-D-alanine ligase [Oscillospiraceae bacterium]
MKPIALGKIFTGTDLDPEIEISFVGTDSRVIKEGSLFVALKGEKFDGHNFVKQVLDNGAVGAVVCGDRLSILKEQLGPEEQKKLIVVEDTLLELGKIAAKVRDNLDIPVVGITGSVGKTSTKDLTACALAPSGDVAKTKLNYNNEIGLPLTIFSVEDDHTALVGEMGMRGLGEIEYLAEILRPDLGIITNIGVSHIERLGSRKNIMLAKTEICAGLKKGATLLVGYGDRHSDDEVSKEAIRDCVEAYGKDIKVKFCGIDTMDDYYGFDVGTDTDGKMSFTFSATGDRVHLQLAGVHNVRNAVMALAAAYELKIPVKDAVKEVEKYCGDSVRQNIIKKNGITIIDDTYNAGPESMQAALAVLNTLPGIKRKIAVLGSMLELGEASEQAHRDVLEAAVKNEVDILITVGVTWGQTPESCPVKIKENCETWQEAIPVIKNLCGDRHCEGDGFLVKGSHAMAMENIVKFLEE